LLLRIFVHGLALPTTWFHTVASPQSAMVGGNAAGPATGRAYLRCRPVGTVAPSSAVG